MSTTLLAEAETRLPAEKRGQTVRQVAGELFSCDPDWITFFREVMGVGGIIRRLYPTPEEYAAFLQSATYAEISGMCQALRERSRQHEAGREPTRVITVRLPASLHQSLLAEAHDCKTSMNQLCISKLLLAMETPSEPEIHEFPERGNQVNTGSSSLAEVG